MLCSLLGAFVRPISKMTVAALALAASACGPVDANPEQASLAAGKGDREGRFLQVAADHPYVCQNIRSEPREDGTTTMFDSNGNIRSFPDRTNILTCLEPGSRVEVLATNVWWRFRKRQNWYRVRFEHRYKNPETCEWEQQEGYTLVLPWMKTFEEPTERGVYTARPEGGAAAFGKSRDNGWQCLGPGDTSTAPYKQVEYDQQLGLVAGQRLMITFTERQEEKWICQNIRSEAAEDGTYSMFSDGRCRPSGTTNIIACLKPGSVVEAMGLARYANHRWWQFVRYEDPNTGEDRYGFSAEKGDLGVFTELPVRERQVTPLLIPIEPSPQRPPMIVSLEGSYGECP